MNEIEILARAHALFAGRPEAPALRGVAGADPAGADGLGAGRLVAAHRQAVAASTAVLRRAWETDAALAAVVAAAAADHRAASHDTGAILAAARRDTAVPDSPLAARELLRRRVLRLRQQQAHVLDAQRRARRRQAALRSLRYGLGSYRGGRPGGPGGRASAAVRAALSKIGRPYVWGAAGPDRFDCSGLVKWAYEQAGIRLPRTTFDQITIGTAVPRGEIRPGDLVFPHTGHVQMALGGGLVVEAPQPGANVQISRLGTSVAIRRP